MFTLKPHVNIDDDNRKQTCVCDDIFETLTCAERSNMKTTYDKSYNIILVYVFARKAMETHCRDPLGSDLAICWRFFDHTNRLQTDVET